MSLWGDLMKFRVPIMLGAGGVVAYGAYQRARAGIPPSAAAGGPAAAAGAAAAPAGIDASQALAVQQAAFTAGGGLGLQGAALGLQTADRALDLAGIATMGAQAVTGDVVGLATNLGAYLGSLAESAVDSLPSFAPVGGIQPQPTQPAPTPAAPPPTPGADTETVYQAKTRPGEGTVYTFDQATGAITGSRVATFLGDGNGGIGQVAVRRAAPYGVGATAWRILAGPLTGWSMLPGSTSTFVTIV